MKEQKAIFKPDFLHIPYQLIDDRELEQTDRLVYGLVYWFEHLRDGRCIASNVLLADLLHTTTRVIQNSLNTLEKRGYIEREYKDDQKRNRLLIRAKIALKYVSPTGDTRKVERPMGDRHERPMGDQNKNNTVKNINTSNAGVAGWGEDGKLINELIELFREVNPMVNNLFARKTERGAIERLLKSNGESRLRLIIAYLPKSNADRFAPTITTPLQLERDLGKLIAWSQKRKAGNSGKGKKIMV